MLPPASRPPRPTGRAHMVFPGSHIEPNNTSSTFLEGWDPPSPCGWVPVPSWGLCLLGGQDWDVQEAHPTLLGKPCLGVPWDLGRGLNLSYDATCQSEFLDA